MQPEQRGNWVEPGALARYFALRWFTSPNAEDERLIAWLLEVALGRNALYFIEKTKEWIDGWEGSGEIVPADALDGFAVTGNPEEDCLIAYAGLVWTHMNGVPWPEADYHRWLDKLLLAGSAEAAYIAASLWPARELMAKVAYRPVEWRIAEGDLDGEAERLVLIEMLKGKYDSRPLGGPYEYDNVIFPHRLANDYIKARGFTHPICGLIDLKEAAQDDEVIRRIHEALSGSHWSDGTRKAAMLLYLSLVSADGIRRLTGPLAGLLKDLREKTHILFNEDQIKLLEFYNGKLEKIEYNLISEFINHFLAINSFIFDNYTLYKDDFEAVLSRIYKYISNGLRTTDILLINKRLVRLIFMLMNSGDVNIKEKVKKWLKKQKEDPRFKDVLLTLNISEQYSPYELSIKKNLKFRRIKEYIHKLYGTEDNRNIVEILIKNIKMFWVPFGDKDNKKICNFMMEAINSISSKKLGGAFISDFMKILKNSPEKKYIFDPFTDCMFLHTNNIGLYLYYEILSNFQRYNDFYRYMSDKEYEVYSKVRNKMKIDLYLHKEVSCVNLFYFYLKKINYNNFPSEQEKKKQILSFFELICENFEKLIDHIEISQNFVFIRNIMFSNMEEIGKMVVEKGIYKFFTPDFYSKYVFY